jgi:hypothetical protein
MKRFLVTLIICLLAAMPLMTMAQDNAEVKATKLIEVSGDHGKILVFPHPVSGPMGPVIKFVMFGITEPPEVIVVTKDMAFPVTVTTIDFRTGDKFFGWFEVPTESITALWMNGVRIPWENR